MPLFIPDIDTKTVASFVERKGLYAECTFAMQYKDNRIVLSSEETYILTKYRRIIHHPKLHHEIKLNIIMFVVLGGHARVMP